MKPNNSVPRYWVIEDDAHLIHVEYGFQNMIRVSGEGVKWIGAGTRALAAAGITRPEGLPELMKAIDAMQKAERELKVHIDGLAHCKLCQENPSGPCKERFRIEVSIGEAKKSLCYWHFDIREREFKKEEMS